MVKNIISFGGGQNSPALIYALKKLNIKIDEILFADVGKGCEMPETYKFLEEFEKYCIKEGLKFTRCKSVYGNIKKYYEDRKLIPFRMFRSCSHRFKVININHYLRDNYPNEIINIHIGFGSDEIKRSINFKNSETKLRKYNFPLIDIDIDRKKCIDIIKSMNLSVPVKSGCWFCPFNTKKTWANLLKKHPDLFEEGIRFEKNCSKYPEFTLLGTKTLESLKKDIKNQTKLIEDQDGLSRCIICDIM